MTHEPNAEQVKPTDQLHLSVTDIDGYFAQTVLPHLAQDTTIVGAHEVTDNSFVNWVFAVDVHHGDTDQDETIYVRQSGDHVKKYPDMPREVSRTETEARALSFLGKLVPGTVPTVVTFDKDNNVLVLTDIKRGGHLLADELAAGRVHPETGITFGNVIGRIQAATVGQTFGEILGVDVLPPKATDTASYLGLRTAKARELAPELTDKILAASDEAPKAFILGDLASKNIFVEDEQERFLDLERVFVGDPAYDPAYLFCHYLIEAKGEGAISQSLEFIHNFMDSYLAQLSQKLSSEELGNLQQRILQHLGMSILHRTQGSHFVSYDGDDKDQWQVWALEFMQIANGIPVDTGLKQVLGIKSED